MHSPSEHYQLIDFGRERKLERIGGLLVNRPCPGAKNEIAGSPLWGTEELFFNEKTNRWTESKEFQVSKSHWTCTVGSLQFLLRPTPTGQIGVFPEHWSHWEWMVQKLEHKSSSAASIRVLNLFAYTGATTLFLAGRGVHVTHVDSSRPTVMWGRQNSEASSLQQASIRWLVEDARRYVDREIKRGCQYEAIILDPPTYGHGAKLESWDIHRDLGSLLHRCWDLLSDDRRFVLLSGHSHGIDLRQIASELRSSLGPATVGTHSIHKSELIDLAGRSLDCGFTSRFEF